jgi:hypothetical protein
LIGLSQGQSGAITSISKSYAAGNITTTANNISFTGGLLGHGTNTTISESWASGSVHAKGMSTGKAAARIFGYPTGNIGADNYAMDVMYLETWDAYRYGTVTVVMPTPTSNATGPHGADATPGTAAIAPWRLGNADFWTSTTSGPGFNSVQVPAHYTWSMSGVARGYPKLLYAGAVRIKKGRIHSGLLKNPCLSITRHTLGYCSTEQQ